MKMSGYLHEDGYGLVAYPPVGTGTYDGLGKKEQACVRFVQFNELRFFKRFIPEEEVWNIVIIDGDNISRINLVGGDPDIFCIIRAIYNVGQWRYAFPSVAIEDVEELVCILEGV